MIGALLLALAVGCHPGEPWDTASREVPVARVRQTFAIVAYRAMLYTVNDPELLAQLVAAGVDGICTDRPDTLAALLFD